MPPSILVSWRKSLPSGRIVQSCALPCASFFIKAMRAPPSIHLGDESPSIPSAKERLVPLRSTIKSFFVSLFSLMEGNEASYTVPCGTDEKPPIRVSRSNISGVIGVVALGLFCAIRAVLIKVPTNAPKRSTFRKRVVQCVMLYISFSNKLSPFVRRWLHRGCSRRS